ncbi:MAG: sigma-70 family RNA polymerase sigma factor [Bacteroidia bacterium]|nr:sigma-70 family RNA polymerase sigma factor [Bacteroidia bacterium]
MKSKNEIEAIYNTYVDNLYSYAFALGFKKHVIMDAIHDVFCKLCTEDKSFGDVVSVQSYLTKSLKNRLIDIYKSQKIKIDIASSNVELILSHTETAEDKLITAEDENKIKQTVNEMIQSLSPRQQEIIILRYVENLSYEEISLKMNISYSSCRKLMHKAVETLRIKYPFFALYLLLI